MNPGEESGPQPRRAVSRPVRAAIGGWIAHAILCFAAYVVSQGAQDKLVGLLWWLDIPISSVWADVWCRPGGSVGSSTFMLLVLSLVCGGAEYALIFVLVSCLPPPPGGARPPTDDPERGNESSLT